MAEMADPLEDGDAAADGEDEEGDDEGPEIEFLAIAKGAFGIGGFLAEADAEEEQELVGGIYQGMDTFGKHGGATGKGTGDEFDDGDEQVCGQGDINSSIRMHMDSQ